MGSKRHIQVGNLYNMLNVGLNISWFPANCIHLQVHYAGEKKNEFGKKEKGHTLQKLPSSLSRQLGGLWLFSDLQWRGVSADRSKH